jgi:bifunctional non-homologous end joining protein LigD
LRGRDVPTVAAPRTWDELADPDLRQLTFDEVLRRVDELGDLLAGLDATGPVPDRLTTYRSMRDSTKTPEPVPKVAPAVGENNRFVIQEHHARRLHYDFRLERDGVLVSWAVPKNLPDRPSVNHLAVHTEDHPLEYASFEGMIPKGEYGGGQVTIWDSGTYEAEKFRDAGEHGKDGEVIVTLQGARIRGRYALIQTDGKQWLAHRMKEQPDLSLSDLQPMLATPGPVERLTASQYAFEGKFDGYRLLVQIERGGMRLQSRSGRDVTGEYPQLESLVTALSGHDVILDGEVVALDSAGLPSFGAMQNRIRTTRIEFWAFDILRLDGRSLLKVKYRDRRRLLETLAVETDLIVPQLLSGDGREALAFSNEQKWEGVVAKKWESTYQPGHRSAAWIKDKNWLTQDVVIGGWRVGNGGRSSGIGALLVGIPGPDGLRFAGRVGTGFSERELARLKDILLPLQADESPFTARLSGPDAKGVSYVRPELVGEVRFAEWTSEGRLRHPSWRGLRPEMRPADVKREGGNVRAD